MIESIDQLPAPFGLIVVVGAFFAAGFVWNRSGEWAWNVIVRVLATVLIFSVIVLLYFMRR